MFANENISASDGCGRKAAAVSRVADRSSCGQLTCLLTPAGPTSKRPCFTDRCCARWAACRSPAMFVARLLPGCQLAQAAAKVVPEAGSVKRHRLHSSSSCGMFRICARAEGSGGTACRGRSRRSGAAWKLFGKHKPGPGAALLGAGLPTAKPLQLSLRTCRTAGCACRVLNSTRRHTEPPPAAGAPLGWPPPASPLHSGLLLV